MVEDTKTPALLWEQPAFFSPRTGLLTADPEAFDIILTDQSMPNMTGTMLIAEARALRPSLPCVLMTGPGDEATARRARTRDVRAIIAKPFPLTSLLSVLERAGDAST